MEQTMSGTQYLPIWRTIEGSYSGTEHLSGGGPISNRPETGPMKFGEDLTGVFIRGDDALMYGNVLRGYIPVIGGGDVSLHREVFKGLVELLLACREGENGRPPPVPDKA